MIYSKDHNFLMLKNVKVGGTSLEVELSKVLPISAIVTPIIPKNKEHKPRHYRNFRNHMPYEEISKLIDLSNAKSYIIIRNPYYMVLSNFFYALTLINVDWNTLNNKEKENFVHKYFYDDPEDTILSMLKSSKSIYMVNNKSIIDQYIRYEDGIEEQINPILECHGIPKITMNTFEKQHRPKNIHPEDIFKDEHMELIKREWFWEFDNLGYNR